MVINGIMCRTQTGCPWPDLPGEYGPWKAAYNRHRRWSLDGTWEEILGRLRAGCDQAEGRTGPSAPIPPWSARAQHAAGARRELPAELVTGGHRRMTIISRAGRSARRRAGPAAG
jgi:transposase